MENGQKSTTPAIERAPTGYGSGLVSSGLIITIKEARKLLGASGKTLTNEEIKTMIRDYTTLARHAVREYLVRK